MKLFVAILVFCVFSLQFLSSSSIAIVDKIIVQPKDEVLKQGKKIMEERCIKCHSLKVINDHTTERWEKVYPRMSKKAKLTIEESQKVKNYIDWKLKHP